MERWGDQGGERWKESTSGGSAVGGSTGAEDHSQRRGSSKTGKGFVLLFFKYRFSFVESIYMLI